jgi:hypothetical protein
MAVTGNRVYNDPALGAAFSNLAGLFAPPSGGDAAGFATAAAKKAEADRLAALYDYAQNPQFNQDTFDRMGIAVGNYAPTQSFYAQDQNNATTIRGQDVTAQTSRMNNAVDNQRSLVTSMFGPLSEGQVRPELPEGIAGMFGVPAIPEARGAISADPGERVVMPDGSMIEGAPKPLSETEQKAIERQKLIDGGMLSDTMLLDAILGDNAPVKVQADGGPRFMTPGEAARTGAAPMVEASSGGTPRNYIDPAGQRGVTLDGMTDAATGAKIAAGSQIFGTQVQGGAADVGLGKTTTNNVDRQLIDLSVARDTAVNLRNMIAASPSSQGVVGWARGTAQNAMQTGNELGKYFGGGLQEVSKAINEGLADASLAGSFDPNIPAIEMMANLLAFQYAKTTTGERLSNEMLRTARQALGLDGLLANQADAMARLDTAVKQMDSQRALLLRAREGGVGALPAPGAAPPPAAPNAMPSANGDIPTVATPEEAMSLPSGTTFRDPQGNIRVRP